MNNFKELLKINNMKLLDESICANFSGAIREVGKEFEVKNDKKGLEVVADREKKIREIFLNYNKNMEIIERHNACKSVSIKKEKGNSEKSQIDSRLKKVIQQSGNNLYKKMQFPQDRIQILDRMVNIGNILDNFDENFEQLSRRAKSVDSKVNIR